MANDISTDKRETHIIYGASFGAAFGTILGTIFKSLGIPLGISIGITLGTSIAIIFGKEIVQLFDDSSNEDIKNSPVE